MAPDDAGPPTAPPIDATVATRFAACLHAIAPEATTARLGVAVSGGPDSLALLLLAHAALPGRITAATVDHGLRPEAAEEARYVASLCNTLGVPHRTLAPDAPIRGSVQAAAREVRYALLARWCEAEALPLLATAHHLDDQAETLMMRLLRGSGVAGLSGVRARSALGRHVTLVRPLLGWRRAELREIVEGCGVAPVDDPSNRDARFDRVRVRARLAETRWIDPVPLAASAHAMAEAEAALQWSADRCWHIHVETSGDSVTIVPDGLPAELLRRLVLRAIERISPGVRPRGEAVQAMIGALHRGETRTLSGVRCAGGACWRFTPAPPRRGN